jgi:hypothetical protein
VAEATSKQVDNAEVMDNPDWQQGYGFQFWLSRHGYRGDGAFGQFCVVLPDHDTVLAMTAATERMQAVLDLAWALLLPALGDNAAPAGSAGDDDAALATRLAGLRLPFVPGAAAPPSSLAAPWRAFAGRTTSGVDLALSLAVDGDARCAVVELHDTDGTTMRVDAPLGTGGWSESGPIAADGRPLPLAASGAWLDAQTLRVDVLFVETPHRFQVTGHLADGTVTVQWLTAPLWDGPLHELRAPRP